ncbi:MAP7 domain-containing protein 3, partial [Galemys pyrenaicus]
ATEMRGHNAGRALIGWPPGDCEASSERGRRWLQTAATAAQSGRVSRERRAALPKSRVRRGRGGTSGPAPPRPRGRRPGAPQERRPRRRSLRTWVPDSAAAGASAARKMADRAGSASSLRGMRERMGDGGGRPRTRGNLHAVAWDVRALGQTPGVRGAPPQAFPTIAAPASRSLPLTSLRDRPGPDALGGGAVGGGGGALAAVHAHVIDGSVLRNDIKQKLAKERREEKRRQQDANKEIQLLEKERKAKILYEKQMEEKQRKLKEQKEKDEQRRISAEEKRKQKLEEEREKFKAVLCRTLERSNRVDHRQKRWSWEGSTPLNSESKAGDKHPVSTEKLGQEASRLQKQMPLSSVGLQNSTAKKKTDKTRSSSLSRRYHKRNSSSEVEQVEEKPPGYHRYTNARESTLISRLLVPTKSSVARSKSVASLSAPGKDVPVTPTTFIQYVNVPLRTHSSDELKAAVGLCKPTTSVPPKEKLEPPPEVSPEASAEASVESPSKAGAEAIPPASEGAPLKASSKTPRVDVEALPERYKTVPPDVSCNVPSKENVEEPSASLATSSKASMEAFPRGNMEELPGVSLEGLPGSEETSPEASVDPSPEVSIDSSPEVSVDPSPEVSIDSSPDVSVDPSPEVSLDSSPEVSVEASSEASPDSSPKASTSSSPKTSEEALLRERVKVYSEARVDVSPEKSELDKQASTPVVKRRPSSSIPCYKWSSSQVGWRPPSPVSPKQIQKNRSSSPSPGVSRQSPPASLCYKVIPVQHTLFPPNVLGATRKKRETVSKPPKRCESVDLKKMSCEEFGFKSTPGTLNAEEATKILAEKRRLAREQKEKEEKLQEVDGRQEKLVIKPAGEDQEASKFDEGQQPKETKTSDHDQDEQRGQHQKGDTKIRAQEEADKRQKEHERIMLQNLKERLERKKRIEEIMKRTRKTDWNASKSVETSSKNTYKVDKADEEDEADDEDESGSEDSLGLHSSAYVNSMHLSTKPKVHFKNARKKAPKLVFLDATSSQVNKETQAFLNGDVRMKQKSVKDPVAQAKGSRASTKRKTNRTAKSKKGNKASKALGSSKSSHSQAQDWVYDPFVDIASETEPYVSSFPPYNQKHYLEGSTLFHQREVSSDVKKKKSFSAQPVVPEPSAAAASPRALLAPCNLQTEQSVAVGKPDVREPSASRDCPQTPKCWESEKHDLGIGRIFEVHVGVLGACSTVMCSVPVNVSCISERVLSCPGQWAPKVLDFSSLWLQVGAREATLFCPDQYPGAWQGPMGYHLGTLSPEEQLPGLWLTYYSCVAWHNLGWQPQKQCRLLRGVLEAMCRQSPSAGDYTHSPLSSKFRGCTLISGGQFPVYLIPTGPERPSSHQASSCFQEVYHHIPERCGNYLCPPGLAISQGLLHRWHLKCSQPARGEWIGICTWICGDGPSFRVTQFEKKQS